MNNLTYDTASLLCPHCHTYLLDANVGAVGYKCCNSCGYTREAKAIKGVTITADIGNGTNPIKDNPELLRPEERGKT
jgi:hypothetical protein